MNKLRNIFLSLSVIALVYLPANAQQPCFKQRVTPWADSLMNVLTLEQKIGQLFMVAAWSDPSHKAYNSQKIQSLVDNYGIGGIIFMQGSPGRQAALTNRYQSVSKVPLMIGMDAEWGLGMRLDSTIAYPRQMTLGASNNDSLVYAFGREMARQLKRLGVHVSFSPCVDINNNAKNPVISSRSFGEQKELVTAHSSMYMKGLQDGGVLACAKHFPGHGDTDVDSHKDLPVVAHSYKRLDSLELYPYKHLIQQGLGSVMTAHLYAPALDPNEKVASTLSREVITNLLRGKLGFNGLVFTDAMNMQGIAKFFKPGEAEVKALQAGNDVLLFSQDVPVAVQKIKTAIDSGWVSLDEVNLHCYRILQAKEWAGLATKPSVRVAQIYEDLNNLEALKLRREIIEESITVVKNEGNTIPLNHVVGNRVAVVSIGAERKEEFHETLAHYGDFDHFVMEKSPDVSRAIYWQETLGKYDLVIAALVNTSNKPERNFGVTNESVRILNSIGENSKVVLSVLANPYSLKTLKDFTNIETVLVAYQDDPMTQIAVAETVIGAIGADGSLPVSTTAQFPAGSGYSTPGGGRLRWMMDNSVWYSSLRSSSGTITVGGSPAGDYEEDMMSDGESRKTPQTIASASGRIDRIAESGILSKAYPGCRVMVAKNGQVVYDKSFGNLDWTGTSKVNENTVYDLASITKVASSTVAAMKLVDMGLLDVNKRLGDYLQFPAGNEYAQVTITSMLSHCAGFTPWIPFYTNTMSNGTLKPSIYKTRSEEGFTLQVAENIFIADNYRDSIFNKIISTPLGSDKGYKYSDLGYYFIQRIVEQQSGMTLDAFVTKHFYSPMGFTSMGYQPLARMKSNSIAPTEDDKTFRGQTLRGHVHDQGAAMMGGVAGHAGLFSNAQDLAGLMQMLMDGGVYGGQRYIESSTVGMFNTRHFAGNRRGLGFDKPTFTPGHGSTCGAASANSFGHTGFTGTMCWADPDHDLVYVFLSNRVHPDAENKKLQELNIRTEIQAEVYKAWGN
jgi:beta-glucosidase-like glycosyl hydrolase/CubicO group peptidase (beta-lactamase class C family)